MRHRRSNITIGQLRARHSLDAAFREFDVSYPIALTPSKALMLAFPVEIRGGMLKLRNVEILKGLRIDHGVEVAFNFTRHYRNHSAFEANMELSGARSKRVQGQVRSIFDIYPKRGRGQRCPDSAVFSTESARASARRHILWVRFALERQRNVPAMATPCD